GDEPDEEWPEAYARKGGRPKKVDPIKLVAWRQARGATVAATAKHWNVSARTVQQYTRDYDEAARQARQQWQADRLDDEEWLHEMQHWQMFNNQLSTHLGLVGLGWFSKMKAAKGTGQEAAVEAAYEAA